jgi:hypothetical protein
MPSALATDVVEAQLVGLGAEIARIDGEIESLKARREGVKMMQKALARLVPKRITPGTGTLQVGQTAPLPMIGRRGNAGTGFREAVRKVLRDNPRGLRPAEVLAEMKRRGELATYTGKTKLGARVQNELYAMKRSGSVSKQDDRYTLSAKEADGA